MTVFVLLVFLVFVIFQGRKEADLPIFDKIQWMRWAIVCIPVVIYFVFVSKSAVYVADRYLFPIYAVTLTIFWCAVNIFLRRLFEEKQACLVMCLIGAIIIVNGFANAGWDYLNRGSEKLLNQAKEYSDEKWKVHPAFYEMVNYKSVTFISQEHIDTILQNRSLLDDGFMLNIIGGNDEKILNMILEEVPYLDQYEKIGGYVYSTTYRVFATGEVPRVQIYSYDEEGVITADGIERGSNVLLKQAGQEVWLIRKDEEHVAIELEGMVLDVTGGRYAEGTNIQLYPANGTDAQNWKLIENSDGSYSLLAKDESFALTCGQDGNICLSEYREGEGSQKWWIRGR